MPEHITINRTKTVNATAIPPVIRFEQNRKKPNPSAGLPWKWIGLVAGLASLSVATIVLVILIAISNPKHSLRNLVAAAESQDRKAVSQYVDAEKVSASMKQVINEMHRRESASNKKADIFDDIGNAVEGVFIGAFSEAIITPDFVIDSICGESTERAINNQIDARIDKAASAIHDDSPEGLAHGLLAAIAKGTTHHLVNSASTDANTNHRPGQTSVSVHYPAKQVLVIDVRTTDSTDPSISYIFQRADWSTWKWVGVRLL